MLTAEALYDILAAKERVLEEAWYNSRRESSPSRGEQLQEHYLRIAAGLSLLPSGFATPRPTAGMAASHVSTPSGSSPVLTPQRQRWAAPTAIAPAAAASTSFARHSSPPRSGLVTPTTSAKALGGGSSQRRVALETARAEAAARCAATAALAATKALLQPRPKRRWGGPARAVLPIALAEDSPTDTDAEGSGSEAEAAVRLGFKPAQDCR
jgi:hypothetical protein